MKGKYSSRIISIYYGYAIQIKTHLYLELVQTRGKGVVSVPDFKGQGGPKGGGS